MESEWARRRVEQACWDMRWARRRWRRIVVMLERDVGVVKWERRRERRAEEGVGVVVGGRWMLRAVVISPNKAGESVKIVWRGVVGR